LPVNSDIEVLKTVHEHGAITDASLSVLSDQLVQKASMDRVVTINRCEQESRGGLSARHPPQQRGRTGMAHGKLHRAVKKYQVAIANVVQTPIRGGIQNCNVIDLSQRNVWAVLAKMRDTQ